MAEKKSSSVAVWTATLFLTVIFLAAGWTKLTGNPAWSSERAHYDDWFFNAIGVLEVSAAVLLLWPRTACLGATTLAVIMGGAVVTQLVYKPIQAVFPALFFVSLSALAYYRFPWKPPPA